jgi:arylsulfatase A-like enzyme
MGGQGKTSSRVIILILVTVALVAALYVSVTRITSVRPPNVLLISIDTLSREHVSAYGYPRATTPGLDRLAAEGAMFTDAVSTTNWTLPAQLSALSGLSPDSHRVQDKHDSLPESVLMLAQIFREEGAATAGFVSHIYLDRKYGFARGFDEYDNAPDQLATQVTSKAADWLARHAGERFFLFLHYFDPHWNLRPPPEFLRRFAPAGVDPARGDFRFLFHHLDPGNPMSAEDLSEVTALYDAEVAFTDYNVGLLVTHLRRAGVLDDTIVVIFSDHGEEIGEHGAFGHGTHLHGEIVGIPLIARYPHRIEGGGVIDAPASITDIPATILDLAGLQIPEQFLEEGTSLFPEKDGQGRLRGRTRVAASSRWGPRRFSVIRDGYKLMTAATYQPVAFERHPDGRVDGFRTSPVMFNEQLYRVSEDPDERTDFLRTPEPEGLNSEYERIASGLRQDLRTHLETRNTGVRIVCEAPSGGEATYGGTVRASEKLRDDVFGFPPRPETVIHKLDDASFRFTLKTIREQAGLVIPFFEPGGTLTIDLTRNGEETYAGTITLPEPGETVALGPDARGCSVTVPIPGLGATGEKVELSAEELDTLRALGYAE